MVVVETVCDEAAARAVTARPQSVAELRKIERDADSGLEEHPLRAFRGH